MGQGDDSRAELKGGKGGGEQGRSARHWGGGGGAMWAVWGRAAGWVSGHCAVQRRRVDEAARLQTASPALGGVMASTSAGGRLLPLGPRPQQREGGRRPAFQPTSSSSSTQSSPSHTTETRQAIPGGEGAHGVWGETAAAFCRWPGGHHLPAAVAMPQVYRHSLGLDSSRRHFARVPTRARRKLGARRRRRCTPSLRPRGRAGRHAPLMVPHHHASPSSLMVRYDGGYIRLTNPFLPFPACRRHRDARRQTQDVTRLL